MSLQKAELDNERIISISESEINRLKKIKEDVEKIDICPLCQSTITKEHIGHVFKDCDEKIKISEANLEKSRQEINTINSHKEQIQNEIKDNENLLSGAEIELIRHKTMKDKKDHLKKIVEEEKIIREELRVLEEKRKILEAKNFDSTSIEERYETKMMEIEEISSRTEEDVDTTLLYKEREVENLKNIIKRSTKDSEDVISFIKEISEKLNEKSVLLKEKEEQEKILTEKFKRMFEERDSLQKEMGEKNISLNEIQNEIREVEDQINYLRIGKAKLDAEKEAFDMESSEYVGVELLTGSMAYLEERLVKSQQALQEIGSINMRALEVYEEVKKEYDVVQEKVNILEKEKQDIMLIVQEIDKKKTRTFMRTFRAMNEIFTQNFSKLYTKGVAFLELENKEEIFAGGVNIVVKLAKGKYFDVTSLSGGEQTLVALSLLFAIQEYKPYHFYIFDEIDAALDKRNSERLAGLLNQYMKSGQYIVISHNDAIIMNANVLYGVSMHESVSRILSLKVSDDLRVREEQERIERAAAEEAKRLRDEAERIKMDAERRAREEAEAKKRAEEEIPKNINFDV